MPFIDYYNVLGLKEGATEKEIKAAYRQLVLKYHPDRHNNDPYYQDRFKEIQQAYEILIKNKNGNFFGNQFRSQRKRVIYDNSSIRIRTNKNVVGLKESFNLEIRVKGTGKNIFITGINQFKIIGVPEINSDVELENGAMAYVSYFTYKLKPINKGYLPLGPVFIDKSNYRFGSNSLFIKCGNAVEKNNKRFLFNDKTETLIFSTVFIVLGTIFSLVLYNLLNPPETPGFESATHSFRNIEESPHPEWDEMNRLNTGDYPFEEYYGRGMFDYNNEHGIRFLTGNRQDAVVILVDHNTKEIVRNEYIQAGSVYEMSHIPDGSYYLKVILGRDWSEEEIVYDENIKGGFKEASVYKIFDHPDFNILIGMDDPMSEETSFYEITLYPVRDGNYVGNRVNPDSFF
ncbi:MAG: hypothetical protein EA412_09925 [Chitinophagaceae bacterium]|nr:MAG: hypothetical protein EA412_09925 [Chitinophagaceae bacterium]